MVKRICDTCGKEMQLSGYIMGFMLPPFNEGEKMKLPKILMSHNGINIDLCEDCENDVIEYMKGMHGDCDRVNEIFRDMETEEV